MGMRKPNIKFVFTPNIFMTSYCTCAMSILQVTLWDLPRIFGMDKAKDFKFGT